MNKNVRLVYEEAIKPDSLYTKNPLDWFLGRCIKMAFQSATSHVEHMWVKVTGVEGDDLVGELANDPVLVTHIRCGDRVILSRVQIEAVDLTFEEWTTEVEQLRAREDYFNRWLGPPKVGSGLENAVHDGLTPRQALVRWRNSVPEYRPDDAS